MKRFFSLIAFAAILVIPASFAQATPQKVWRVESPNHGQTFAYGSVQNHAWMIQGSNRHLALHLNLTNDPYVDIDNPRQYDSFIFNFPNVTLGKDSHTFYYRSPDGNSVPVAVRHPGFLGIEQIRLLPNAYLEIQKPHGYLTLAVVLGAVPVADSAD
jgi:hypothetical protein